MGGGKLSAGQTSFLVHGSGTSSADSARRLFGSTSMRISLMHYSAPLIVGGVESVLDHHARLMADEGHEVQIIAARGKQVDSRIKFLEVPLADSRHPQILDRKQELDTGIVSEKFHELTQVLELQLEPLLANTDTLIAHNVCSLNKNLPLTAALFNLSRQKK